MPKSFIAFIFIALVLVSILFVQHQNRQAALVTPIALLTDFSLPDTLGKVHSIYDWQGKILIINFWATWCLPCLEEIPGFIALQKEYTTKNIQFIGIAIDKVPLVTDYISTANINYPILMAESNGTKLMVQLGNPMRVIPYTLIVMPDKKIIYQHLGDLTKKELRAQIEALGQGQAQAQAY